jgi:hypothetical protein
MPRLFLVLCLLLPWLPAPATEPPRRITGEIAGAPWLAFVPENWSGRLLLIAPDQQEAEPESLLDPNSPDNRELLEAGWTLATTGYRRRGIIVGDAIEDLRNLRDHIANEVDAPKLSIVCGYGLGGLLATIIVERHAAEFHAGLAISPQLSVKDPRAPSFTFDQQPRAPLLILFRQAAMPDVLGYRDGAHSHANAESVVPALWFQSENSAGEPSPRLTEALAALAEWVATGRPSANRLDGLPAESPPPKQVPASSLPPQLPTSPAPPVDEPPPPVPIEEAPPPQS